MKIRTALCPIGVLATLLAMPCAAQTASPAEPTANTPDDGEIIVQARRREESVQDVPLVVNTVTTQQIQRLNIRNFNEVQTLVPGLQLRSEANGIGGAGQLRGVQYDVNVSQNPTVAFYQNDAPVQATAVLQTLYDVGQIEVQRGPQGTLRGQASPSGSITVTTKKPDLNRIGANINVTGNTIGTINANGGFGLPIIEGILAIRVAGAVDQNEGNRVRTIQTNGDHRDPYAHTESGRVSLLAVPADWLRLEGVYQRIDSSSRGFDQYESFSLANPAAPASTVLITPDDRRSITAFPRSFKQSFDIFNWRAEVRGLGQSLIYQGNRYTLDLHSVTNSDVANFLPNRNFFQTTNTHNTSESHEVRLQNEERLFDRIDYVAGFFTSRTVGPTNLTTETPVLLPAALGGGLATVATTPISVVAVALKETSFFGNATLHLGSSTEIAGGARHIKQTQPTGGLVIAGNTIPTRGVDDSGWIYTASIKHNFAPNLMVYANTGTSRRPGSNATGDFSVRPSALETSFLYLPTERSQNFEVGFKSNFLEDRLRLNVSAYHQRFKDYPYRSSNPVFYVNYAATVSGGAVTVTPSVGSFNFVAAVPVRVNGVEGDLAYSITPDWNVGVLASYSVGKIKNGLIPCNDINGDGIPDGATSAPTLAQLQATTGANNLSSCRTTQRSANQAPFSTTVQSEYHQSLTGGLDGFVRGLFTYYGKSQGDPSFAYDQIKAYGLLNMFVGVRDPKGMWELTVYGKNLFDVTRATSINAPATTSYQRLVLPTFTAQSQTFTSSYSIVNSTPPREFGLNLRYAFGAR